MGTARKSRRLQDVPLPQGVAHPGITPSPSPFAHLELPEVLPDAITREAAESLLKRLKESTSTLERLQIRQELDNARVFPTEVLFPNQVAPAPRPEAAPDGDGPALRLVTDDVAAAPPPATARTRNLEAEVNAIACMIARPDAIGPILAVAPAAEYGGVAQAPIVWAITGLRDEGKPVDAVLLRERLSTNPVAVVSGALASLEDLMKLDPPDVVHGLEYARIIHEKFLLRETRRAKEELGRLTQDDKLGVEEFQAAANSLLTDLGSRTGDWEPPQLDGLLPAVPFPLDAIPAALADLAVEIMTLTCCPVESFLLPALTFAGASIGMSVGLKLKTRWVEYPNLWTAYVVKKGTGKTAALDQAQQPMMEIFDELLEEHALVRQQCKELKRAAVAKRSARGVSGPMPDLDDAVEPLRRNVINDTTWEAVSDILAVNPRGLVIYSDELSGWLKGMDQYKAGGGNDLERWLSSWSGHPIVVDRKGKEGVPLVVRRPFVSATGGIQPTKLMLFSESIKREDGFIDRILFSYPETVPQVWNEDVGEESPYGNYRAMIRKLWHMDLTIGNDGRAVPRIVQFEPEAKEAWIEWFNTLCREFGEPDFPEHLRGYWSKLRIQCARLALIIELIDRAYARGWKGRPGDVRLTSLQSAFRLMEYFKTQFRRVYAAIRGEKHEHAGATAILNWIIKGRRSRFSERDLNNNFRHSFGEEPDAIPDGLKWLKERHCIRVLIPVADPRRRGRTPSPAYETNPSLFEKRLQNTRNSEVVGTP